MDLVKGERSLGIESYPEQLIWVKVIQHHYLVIFTKCLYWLYYLPFQMCAVFDV